MASSVANTVATLWSRGPPLCRDRLLAVAYGGAHFGKSLLWYSSELLFAYFLTDICGLAPAQMGNILALGLGASAVADLLVGQIIRRGLASTSSAARLQSWGCGSSIVALALFSTVSMAPMPMRYPLCIVTGVVFRTAYALYDIPQNAILSLAGADSAARAHLSGVRTAFSGLATLVVCVAAAPTLIGGDSQERAWRFFGLIVIFSGLGAAGAFALRLAARGGQEPRSMPFQARLRACSVASPAALWSATWCVFGIVALLAGTTSSFTRLEPYFAASAFSTNLARGVVIGAVAVGGIASQWVWTAVLRRCPASTAWVTFATMMALGTAMFLACAQLGAVVAATAGFVLGCGSSGVSMLLWARIADLTAHAPPDSRWFSPGQMFSMLTAVIKGSLALSALAVGYALGQIGHRPDLTLDTPLLVATMSVPMLICAVICIASTLPKRLRAALEDIAP